LILFLLRRESSGVTARVCTGAKVLQCSRVCVHEGQPSGDRVAATAAGGTEDAASPCAIVHCFRKATVLTGNHGRTAPKWR